MLRRSLGYIARKHLLLTPSRTDLKISPVRSQFPFSNLCLKPFVKVGLPAEFIPSAYSLDAQDDGSNVAITVAGLESSYLYRSGEFAGV